MAEIVRVLMLNYEFPPLGGGAGNAMLHILKEFRAQHDLQIDVVTSSIATERKEKFSDNITVYFLDIGKRKQNLHYQAMKDLVAYTSKSYGFCRRLMAQGESYDLCHAFFGIPCGFVARRLGLPYIVSLRGSDVPFYNQRFSLWDAALFQHMSRGIWKHASRVVANSDALKQLALKTAPKQDIDIVYNGVDIGQFSPRFSPSATLRLLCVSRLIRRKGIEYLLKAVAQLKDENISLTIVGEGNQGVQLKRMAKELGISSKVRFAGAIAHDSLPGVYRRHDVFVLPSLSEGMNNAVLEAMACGLPVIMTDTGGAFELIRGNGLIVAKADYCALAEALKKFVLDRSLVTALGVKSRSLAMQVSWHAAAKQYYNLYRLSLSRLGKGEFVRSSQAAL